MSMCILFIRTETNEKKKCFSVVTPFLKKGGGEKTCYPGKALAEIPFLLVIIKPLTLSGTNFFLP